MCCVSLFTNSDFNTIVVVFIVFEFREEEASETLASLSHEISSAHFTRHPAAFSAGEKLLLMFVCVSFMV
jgi:hypothetical protein